ncbi:hypothetical protein ABPG75_011443 [Micractinium tetrahymenae]
MGSPLLHRSLAALRRLLDGRFASLVTNSAAADDISDAVDEFFKPLWDARDRGEQPDEATLDSFIRQDQGESCGRTFPSCLLTIPANSRSQPANRHARCTPAVWPRSLCPFSHVAILCSQLEALDGRLQQRLLVSAAAARRGDAGAAERASAARGQVLAAAVALRGCVIAAEHVRFGAPAVQQVQRGFAFIFNSGLSTLAALLGLPPTGPPPGEAARAPKAMQIPLPHELPTEHDLTTRAVQA